MPTPERFVEGYRDGHRDADLGTAKRLCVTSSGSEPAVVKGDDPLYYHAYKRALADAGHGRDDMSAAWHAFESKHQSRPDTLTANAYGIYRDWNVYLGDYVLRRHRGRVYVDRIGTGGTHTTIGSANGFPNVDRAIEGLKRDAHIQSARGELGVYNSEGQQLGSLEGGEFDPWESGLEEMVSNKGWKVTADFGVHEQNAPRRDVEKETAVQTWMGTHVDDYYDSVGEPDYTGLADSAAYANGASEMLVEDHPIWEWSTMAFKIAEED